MRQTVSTARAVFVTIESQKWQILVNTFGDGEFPSESNRGRVCALRSIRLHEIDGKPVIKIGRGRWGRISARRR